jgi:hypothetical protein
MEPEDSFSIRVGMFLMVIGGGAFLLFVVSDIADRADFEKYQEKNRWQNSSL